MGFVGMADSKCVTDVGHKVQLPLGPSTRLCLETIRYGRQCRRTIRYERGHNVQPPLGPSTGRLSEKLGFGGVFAPQAPSLPYREGGTAFGRDG